MSLARTRETHGTAAVVGLLAIQDGRRSKPMDTFPKEALTQIMGRSIYTDKTGKVWRPGLPALLRNTRLEQLQTRAKLEV